ncbi:transcriptional regulator, DeoR family [Duganella sp. CF402]|uniref:DeoR/GlpR family DNA-binding transcription regulator n=1 Tax=unclassified Duganella TaxID=2636909 RepID=UPI0008CB20E8|nr:MULTISPECIES: DeoR/GlpR family DNA-binding transcription regulator [unclassified Duganella]RZT08244.1 DeoR family transcriptional regulator [Duganella sp. BK701]SEM00895.1 transcriptional regulator, DeoR family [Duganella sp. CF402]
MLEYERHALIRRLLAERSAVSVGEFGAVLGASAATVRRDISVLAERGELRRVRGGALAPAENVAPVAIAPPRSPPPAVDDGLCAIKRAIGRAAAALIDDSKSIIINGGTTTLAMAEFIVERELDVLTNSIPVAAHLMRQGRCRVSLPGGVVCREQQVLLSPFENDTSENYWAGHMFMGAQSVNQMGAMESDPLIVQAVLRLMRRAEHLVVLADSRKLRQRSCIVTAELTRIHTLVTDSGATDAELMPIRAAGVRVIIADLA